MFMLRHLASITKAASGLPAICRSVLNSAELMVSPRCLVKSSTRGIFPRDGMDLKAFVSLSLGGTMGGGGSSVALSALSLSLRGGMVKECESVNEMVAEL